MVKLCFTENVTQPRDIISVKMNDDDNFVLEVPVIIRYVDNQGNETTLLKTSFVAGPIDPAKLATYYEKLSYHDFTSWAAYHFFEGSLKFVIALQIRGDVLANIDSKPVYAPIPIVEASWKRGSEFILVDEESYFAGNFVEDGRQGVHLSFGKRDVPYSRLSLRLSLSEYDLSYKLREKMGANFTLYGKSKQEVDDFWISLPVDEQVAILKKKHEQAADLCEGRYLPYYVGIFGNGNESWHKYFATEKEMLNEIKYLRLVMPINKKMDIIDRGYVFTN